MSKYILVTCQFIVIFWLFLAPRLHGQSHGYLTLEGVTTQAGIWLDDSVALREIPDKLPLIPGPHKVTILNQNRLNAGHSDFTQTINIAAGQETKVAVSFEDKLELNSKPHGAYVFIDGDLMGKTPLWLDKDKVLNQSLKIDMQGYEIIETRLTQLSEPFVDFDLVRQYSNTPGRSIIKLHVQKYKPKTYRGEIAFLSSLSILSGGIAAYYKIKADKAFDEAKRALSINDDPARRRFNRRAKNFDRKSLYGFIGMQVNFLGVIYYLFRAE